MEPSNFMELSLVEEILNMMDLAGLCFALLEIQTNVSVFLFFFFFLNKE
jgi:hypothetical protein